jgi:hypothetical protein
MKASIQLLQKSGAGILLFIMNNSTAFKLIIVFEVL